MFECLCAHARMYFCVAVFISIGMSLYIYIIIHFSTSYKIKERKEKNLTPPIFKLYVTYCR